MLWRDRVHDEFAFSERILVAGVSKARCRDLDERVAEEIALRRENLSVVDVA